MLKEKTPLVIILVRNYLFLQNYVNSDINSSPLLVYQVSFYANLHFDYLLNVYSVFNKNVPHQK